ncbi:MAG: asparagine synthase (glutamine-hydrolyzing) [Solirubrobacteraceae bacterium]
MCAALEHRGPDSRGLFREQEAGLGIQRLRVVDLVTGDQPISNEDKSVVVVLNGEIYNFQELRKDLQRRGHRFATQGDTEVIVHLYEEHGSECVRYLHGMFAFALWDQRRRQLLLARDRVGKKPLFYALGPEGLAFASELRALLEDRSLPRELDTSAVDCFLAYGYIPAPLSIFAGVRKLPPAHTLVLERGEVKLDRYWRLDYSRKVQVKDPRELHESVRSHLRTATRRRLIGDVPLGAFLSGGIDSSAVVAAMAEASSGPVKTFSIGFDHDNFDELRFARRIADLFGTDHHEFVVRPDAIEMLPKIVRHYGEPFADSSAIPSFYLAELTSQHVTVALNGDGGDESFAGYTRYVSNRLAARLERFPAPLRRVAANSARTLGGGELTSVANKARRLITGLALAPAARYESYMSAFNQSQRANLYTEEFAEAVDRSLTSTVIEERWEEASGDNVLDVMLEVDVTTYLPGDLITKIDIATMAYSLEARSPLLDHQLMEFAASIPEELKLNGRQKKWVFREALRGWLPDDILDRPKQGFTVPLNHWLRGELHDLAREVLLDRDSLTRSYFRREAVQSILDRHSTGADEETKRLWALFVFELWHREFVDHTTPAALEAVA